MVTARGSSSKVSESPGPNRHLNRARRTSYRSCLAVVGRFRKQPRRLLPFRSSDRRIHWGLPVLTGRGPSTIWSHRNKHKPSTSTECFWCHQHHGPTVCLGSDVLSEHLRRLFWYLSVYSCRISLLLRLSCT